jgi:17beta-estradiol 17-dehydrogenase / 3beta-hydroxysteroid 3-dehydrogenase
MEGLQRWRGRIALVTGASGGIGEGIARALAGIGMKVVIVARRRERLDALAAELGKNGAQMMVCAGDVGNESEVLAMFDAVNKQWGAIDVLVNNAGTGMMSKLEEGQWQDWRDTLNINVAAPALFVREALRGMYAKGEAQIINLSSIYGHRDQVPNFSFYQASKFAVRALTDTLRAELAAKGAKVRVGMISPGLVATEFRERASEGKFKYESYFEKYKPLLPSDIADAVLYMLSTPPHVQVQDILLSPMGQGL